MICEDLIYYVTKFQISIHITWFSFSFGCLATSEQELHAQHAAVSETTRTVQCFLAVMYPSLLLGEMFTGAQVIHTYNSQGLSVFVFLSNVGAFKHHSIICRDSETSLTSFFTSSSSSRVSAASCLALCSIKFTYLIGLDKASITSRNNANTSVSNPLCYGSSAPQVLRKRMYFSYRSAVDG